MSATYSLAPGYDAEAARDPVVCGPDTFTPDRARALPPNGALRDTLTRTRLVCGPDTFTPARAQRFGDTPNGNRPPAPVEGQLWPRGNNN